MKLVAFPFHDWRKGQREGLRWRDGHLLQEFAGRPEVERLLVVDRPVSRVERLARGMAPAVVGDLLVDRRAGSSVASITEVAPKIAVLDIAVPDLASPILRRRGWWFDVFTSPDVQLLIEWAVNAQLGASPAAIAWLPPVAPVIERLRPAAFVFDSLDNWLIHPQFRHLTEEASAAYETICARADRVVVSAGRSRDALARWSNQIDVIPNGVDPAMFSGPAERPGDLPAPLVVGYAGSLGPRIDVDLVLATAAELPEVTFVFIGQWLDRATPRALRRAPNVKVMGDRHYSLLPSYLRSFDLGWIPHTVGDGESGGDPIKLYEYWAAGLQVVSTRIDGLDRWGERIHLIADAAEAATTIDGLLTGRVAPKAVSVPEDRTWRAIADDLLSTLEAQSR